MSIKGRQTFDQERVHFNIARLKKGGITFEIAVDPDAAVLHRSKGVGTIQDILRSEKIFAHVSKGVFAAEHDLKNVFGTTDVPTIAEQIIKEGEIQLTEEYRVKLREQKYKRLVALIAQNAIDPRTKLPHPPQRIENALNEANVHLDDFKSADEQLDAVVHKLQPILPIKFETKMIHIHIPAKFAGKSHAVIAKFAKPQKDEWHTDGSFSCIVEIPGGMELDLYDKLRSLTHGNVETKVVQ